MTKAQDWRWSSLWRQESGGVKARAILARWPVPGRGTGSTALTRRHRRPSWRRFAMPSSAAVRLVAPSGRPPRPSSLVYKPPSAPVVGLANSNRSRNDSRPLFTNHPPPPWSASQTAIVVEMSRVPAQDLRPTRIIHFGTRLAILIDGSKAVRMAGGARGRTPEEAGTNHRSRRNRLKYFDRLAPLLARLDDVGCERDRAGNRQLHFDQYCMLILLYLFNPIVTSLRGLQQASELAKVQKRLGCSGRRWARFQNRWRCSTPSGFRKSCSNLEPN